MEILCAAPLTVVGEAGLRLIVSGPHQRQINVLRQRICHCLATVFSKIMIPVSIIIAANIVAVNDLKLLISTLISYRRTPGYKAHSKLRLKKWCKAISTTSSLHYATSLQPKVTYRPFVRDQSIVFVYTLSRGSSKRRERLSMKCVATNHLPSFHRYTPLLQGET